MPSSGVSGLGGGQKGGAVSQKANCIATVTFRIKAGRLSAAFRIAVPELAYLNIFAPIGISDSSEKN
jgi:hypothetical protein